MGLVDRERECVCVVSRRGLVVGLLALWSRWREASGAPWKRMDGRLYCFRSDAGVDREGVLRGHVGSLACWREVFD